MLKYWWKGSLQTF